MNMFSIIDAADQQFGMIIDGRRITIRLRYNPTNDRWSFDLSIDDLPVLVGRRIVTGIDLLAAFNFGLGAIFASTITPGAEPDRAALPAGNVAVFQVSQAEVETVAVS